MRLLVVACAVLLGCGGDPDGADLAATSADLSTVFFADGGVQCGAVECHPGLSQICCAEPQYEYCASSEACSAGIAIYCDGPADCVGGVCCQIAPSTVSCAPTCTGAVVCRSDADCPPSAPRCDGTLGTSTHRTCSS